MSKHLTKDGRDLIIRRADQSDAENIIRHSKIVFASTDQLLTTLEEYTITIDEEKNWIHELSKNASNLILIAELNNEVVGLLFFASQTKKKNSHVGEFGLNVHPAYQSIGIGLALIQNLTKWAKDHRQIEKIFLQVFATNTKAIKLYKDLGFIEEGRHIKAVKQKTGEYIDVIQMYMDTK